MKVSKSPTHPPCQLSPLSKCCCNNLAKRRSLHCGITLAQQGVTDPQALAEDAVRFVRANYKDDLSGKA